MPTTNSSRRHEIRARLSPSARAALERVPGDSISEKVEFLILNDSAVARIAQACGAAVKDAVAPVREGHAGVMTAIENLRADVREETQAAGRATRRVAEIGAVIQKTLDGPNLILLQRTVAGFNQQMPFLQQLLNAIAQRK